LKKDKKGKRSKQRAYGGGWRQNNHQKKVPEMGGETCTTKRSQRLVFFNRKKTPRGVALPREPDGGKKGCNQDKS